MATAKVEIWKDCGYTEGTLEVPSSSSLSNPYATFTGLQISRETLFSQLKLKRAYEDLYDCSYLRITLDMNNGDDLVLYGWIDRTACGSDTAGSPMTVIDWHVDYWRTYFNSAKFGSGIVTRRPATSNDPPQVHSYITNTADGSTQSITTGNDDTSYYWAIVNVTTTDSSVGTTFYQTFCWMVNPNIPDTRYTAKYQTYEAQCPSYRETVTGQFDELLQLDPDAIYAAWLSPIAPSSFTVSSGYFYLDGWRVKQVTSGSNTYGCFFPVTSASPSTVYAERSKGISVKTTDTDTFIVCDMDNEPCYQFPYGLNVTEVHYRIVNADVSAYMSLRFVTDDSKLAEAGSDTLTCNIPLKSLAVSSNAYSSYIYSGQQEYDRREMQIQRQLAATQAITSTLTGSTSNAVMASLGNSKTNQNGQYMLNSAGKPVPTGSGAVNTTTKAGMSTGTAAILTMGTGLVGAGLDYWSQGVANDRVMANTLRYKASQASTLTLPGSGTDFIGYGNKPVIRCLTWDSYSKQQRQASIDLYGVEVEEPNTYCKTLIMQGGPLQIQNLTVTGSIPSGAKQYFRQRFADGVRIV